MLKSEFHLAQEFIRETNNVLDLQRRKPELAHSLHTHMVDNLPQLDEIHNFSLGVKIAQLHYFMQYVHDDARKNGHFKELTTSVGTQSHIDEDVYGYEISAIKKLKKSIQPPLQLFDLMDRIADYLAAGFGDPLLTDEIALFPYRTVDYKLFWSDTIGHALFECAQGLLQLPVKPTFTMFHDDPASPFVKARFIRGRTKDGDPISAIQASARSLNQGLLAFMADMCHEHVHSLFDQMATLYEENPESFEDHPYRDTLLYTWSISHTKKELNILPSIYNEDMEEMFCNGTAGRFVRQIIRFSPHFQITHQPQPQI